MRYNKRGYILITTLIFITGLSMLVVSLLRVVWTAQEFSGFSRDRVHARSLALSGIEIAKAQLAQKHDQDAEQDQQEQPQQQAQQQDKQQQGNDERAYLLQLVRYINQWQRFTLTQETDGADGTIYIYVTPEAGKIPLQSLFDADNKKLTDAAQQAIPDMQKPFEAIGLQGDLKAAFDEIAQEGPIFDDPTQLIEKHSTFAFFDERRFLQRDEQNQDTLQTQSVPVLFDLVTTHTEDETFSMHPLYLSQSLCTVLGLSPLPSGEQRQSFIDTLQEQLPEKVDWKRDWDTLLAPVYKKQFAELPESIQNALTSESGVTYFSVVSYSYVNGARVYLYAIIERVAGDTNDTFRVHRMYWI